MAERGKGKTVYVGGFDQTVSSNVLLETFTTFGDVVDIQIPLDLSKRPDEEPAHRGFGFIEFSAADEAHAAIDNMHQNELRGRVLKVNLARPPKGQSALGTNKAVWEDEAWLAQFAKPAEAGEDTPMGDATA